MAFIDFRPTGALFDNKSLRMRTAELIQQRKFRLLDQAPPEPRPGEVQAKVCEVGACGSDLHYYLEGGIGDTPCEYPMVLGHEPTGFITKVGPGTTGWSVGDRVALEPALYCYRCEYCLTGHHNVCEKIQFMSMPDKPGFFRDYVTLPVANLLPIPKNLGLREATLFEPLAVIINSMNFIRILPGETAMVTGAGPIGLLTIALLKLSGARRIWAIEPVEARRALALTLGADAALDPKEGDVVKQILADTGNRGVDAAVDCAAKGASLDDCISVTRAAGRVVITGIPTARRISLDFHTVRRKELRLYNTRRSKFPNSEAAIRLLESYPGRFVPMITHVRSLDDVGAAFETLAAYADGVGKLAITLTTT